MFPNTVSFNNLYLDKKIFEAFLYKNIHTLIFNNVGATGHLKLPQSVEVLHINDFYGSFYDFIGVKELYITKYIGEKILLPSSLEKYEGKIEYTNGDLPNSLKYIKLHNTEKFTRISKFPLKLKELIIMGKYDISDQNNLNKKLEKLEIYNLSSSYEKKIILKINNLPLLKYLKLFIDIDKFSDISNDFLNDISLNLEYVELHLIKKNENKIFIKLHDLNIKKIILDGIYPNNINYEGKLIYN